MNTIKKYIYEEANALYPAIETNKNEVISILIENGINGYLYESTNSKELAKLLDHCILKTSSEKVEFSEENSSQEIKLSNALFQNLKVFS